ncbi:MAG: tRNA(Ile)-lysidine synthase [Chlamydiia bacterium]|nr:tRNA(Ile)-lysidine synthase [Chlamydiia bacterium]MCH9617945.1 tRNA(Ile)-lysidine synthase [Chlamydiia bacterium]MCH9624576.1 tRNA(Ile)-lysidine synthase [Chlamydiia bacterium]
MIQNAKKRLIPLQGKILLGLSGGPDSMCLCALLMELGKEFHIAHIDHGLQSSSTSERERLALFAKENDIDFHTIILEGKKFPKKNLEDVLRNKRREFFKKVMEREGLDLLLLGHQKDERAETIVKRFFEGGSILNLPGIKLFSTYDGVQTFRPLLCTTKKAVIEYLDKRNIEYFVDPTNFGTENLRAKMRGSLLPVLEKEFGKNIVSSVCDLGDQVDRMAKYIDGEVSKIEGIGVEGIFGVFYPYKENISPFLFTELIVKVLKEKNIPLSREQRLFLEQSISLKTRHKRISLGRHLLFLEKSGIFLIDSDRYLIEYATIPKNITWQEYWLQGKDVEGFSQISQQEYDHLLSCKQRSDLHRKGEIPLCLRTAFPIPLTAIRKNIKINSMR